MVDENKKSITVVNAEQDNGTAFDSQPKGVIFEILRDGKIAYVSSGLEKTTGFKSYEIIGKDILEFFQLLLGENYSKQLLLSVSEVLRGSRRYLDANVQATNPQDNQRKLYNISMEASNESFNRAIMLLNEEAPRKITYELDQEKLRSLRIMEYGHLIVVNADPEFHIQKIIGDTSEILGVPAKLLEDNPQIWNKLIHPEDNKKLSKKVYKLNKNPQFFKLELRFINPKTKEYKWILFSAVPIRENNLFIGWEGFGIDINDKKKAEILLKQQTTRYNALYKLTSTLQTREDPANLALKGLEILISATDSCCGFVCFYDHSKTKLDLVASSGLNQEKLQFFKEYSNLPESLINNAIVTGRSVTIKDYKKQTNIIGLADLDDKIKSLTIVPLRLKTENEVEKIGVLAVFKSSKEHYSNNDLGLLLTGANQIALICKQAEYILVEQAQADSINILYKLSHKLTKALSTKEIADVSFPIIQSQIAAKRIWMGILSSRGTHILGISGIGNGMRKAISNIQIELGVNHQFLDEAIKTKKPLLFDYSQDVQCSGLKKILDILQPKQLLIMPMLSVGKVVGVLVIEPQYSNLTTKNQFPILSSIANEMATAILSKKLEDQFAQSQKMKMAGMLSSGVSHNFNNLLQAIMGQASLLESKLDKQPELQKFAEQIINAAEKGAGLIRKMTNLVNSESKNSKVFRLDQLLLESKDLFFNPEDENIKFSYNQEFSDSYEVYGDYNKIQQVLSSIIANAKDAIQSENKKNGQVKVNLSKKDVFSSEVDPDLMPGQYWTIDVVDNGIGMIEEHKERCFEPFFTTKDSDDQTGVGYSGTGLGLSSAYNVIKAHNGIITVDSALHNGSTFTIYLPVHNSRDNRAISNNKTNSQENKIDNYQAVIIDQATQLPQNIKTMLRNLKFKVLNIKNLSKLESYFEIPSFVPDILILNLDIIETDITEFIKKYKTQYPSSRIVGFTAQVKRWASILRFFDDLSVLEAPLNIIDLNRVLKKIIVKSAGGTLIEKIEVQRENQNRLLGTKKSIY